MGVLDDCESFKPLLFSRYRCRVLWMGGPLLAPIGSHACFMAMSLRRFWPFMAWIARLELLTSLIGDLTELTVNLDRAQCLQAQHGICPRCHAGG